MLAYDPACQCKNNIFGHLISGHSRKSWTCNIESSVLVQQSALIIQCYSIRAGQHSSAVDLPTIYHKSHNRSLFAN